MSDTAQAVEAIFSAMPGRFNASAAEGMSSVIQYDLTGDGGGKYHAKIQDGACAIEKGAHEGADMTMTIAATDFVDMIEGRLDGMSAFMSGKLKIAGDMGLAMKMQNLFTS